MQIVVAGAGKLGQRICAELVRENHDVILIELDEQKLESVIDRHDLSGLAGNAASYAVLMEANVPSCDVFIAMTGSDEVNLMASILANRLGARMTVARVVNPDYSTEVAFVRESFGITHIINPKLEAAREIVRAIGFPSAVSIETFASGRVNIVGVRVPEGSPLHNLRISDFKQKCGELLVCAINRGSEVFIPDGSGKIMAGDTVHVTGNREALSSFYVHTNRNVRPIKSLFVIGGGAVTYWLLQLIGRKRYAVRVVENDHDTARALHDKFPWVDVVYGDGTDQQLLDELSVEQYDAVVSLTGIDEENVLASLYASHRGVTKTITKINRVRLLEVLKDSDIQNVLTPHHIVADEVLRAVRAMENSEGSAMEALYRLEGGRVEALEFIAAASSRVIGVPLIDLPVRSELRIAWIIRGDRLIFPGGHDCVMAGDRVIVVAAGGPLSDLDEILEA